MQTLIPSFGWPAFMRRLVLWSAIVGVTLALTSAPAQATGERWMAPAT